jgi:hypothetical protein
LARDVAGCGYEGSENAYQLELERAWKEVTCERQRGDDVTVNIK